MNSVIKMSRTWTALLFSCVLLAACGGGGGSSSDGESETVADSSGGTGSGSDDTGSGDTGSGSSGSDTSGSDDTGSDDTASGGTGSGSAGSGDTGSDDTGSDDAGSDDGSDGDGSSGDDGASGSGQSATLSWLAPGYRVDGDQISPADLVSYTIRYGKDSNNLDQSVVVDDVSGQKTISYTIENLDAGTWYFSIQAQDRVGLVSEPSDVVSKTIES